VIFFVDVANGNDSNIGSANNPFKTITHARSVAVSGNEIRVAQGTYDAASGETLPITVKNAVKLKGGYNSDFSQRDYETFVTTLNGGNASQVVSFSGVGNQTELSGFVITAGQALNGGGISCESSSPTITNCTITGNTSDNYGGGIYCEYSSPAITNCTITGNTANIDGGGIFCESSPTITYCDFYGNSPDNAFKFGTGSGGISDFPAWGWDGTGCISEDPLFVNSGVGNYHIQAGSPCINTGDPGYGGYLLDGNWETQEGVFDTEIVDMGFHYPYIEV